MLRSAYRRVLILSASPRAPLWLFAIAFAEASFLPVPPDILLVPLCLARPRRAFALALLCTLGSVCGALLGYTIGATLFDEVARPLFHFYGYDHAVAHFLRLYARWGFWVILLKGLTPIPFKIVTIASGAAHYDLPLFVLACAVTRGVRFFLIAALLRRYGDDARVFIEDRLGWVVMGTLLTAGAGILALRFL